MKEIDPDGVRERRARRLTRGALLGVLGTRYIYPKYFIYKVLVNIDFWV